MKSSRSSIYVSKRVTKTVVYGHFIPCRTAPTNTLRTHVITSSLHSRPIFLPPAARIHRQEAPVHSPTRPRCEGGKRPHRSHRKQLFRRNRKTISFKAPLTCNRVTNSLSIVFLRLPLLTFTLSTPNMHTKKHIQNHLNKLIQSHRFRLHLLFFLFLNQNRWIPN